MDKPSEILKWIAKRTGRTAEIKRERTPVSHIDWNTVQLLFEISDNNADGIYKLIQVLDEMYADEQTSRVRLYAEIQIPDVCISTQEPQNLKPGGLWCQLL